MYKLRRNFLKSVKMHLACSSESLRPVMQHIFFKDGYAYASDSHILIKNKLTEIVGGGITNKELQMLDGKLIHKSSYQKMLAYDIIKIVDNGFLCWNMVECGRVIFTFADSDLNYPDAEVIFQQVMEKSGSVSRVCLNSSLLNKLGESLYNDKKLVLFLSGENDQILVKSQDTTIESKAVIMPITIVTEVSK